MRIILYHQMSDQPWATPWIEAFADGLRRHEVEVERRLPREYTPCDLSVTWGVGGQKGHILQAQKQGGRRHLVMERGYIGPRERWCSLGFDGLNGRADFCNADVPSDRWYRHFAVYMRPWREALTGDYCLLLGQVPGDNAVAGVDLPSWYRAAANELCNVLDKPVMFRAHPVAVERGYRSEVDLPMLGGTLEEALSGAVVAAAYSSNSATDAVLAGVPTITMDQGAMAYPVTSHRFDHIWMPDRLDWARRMAYAQWTMEEIRCGDAWAHLRQGLS